MDERLDLAIVRNLLQAGRAVLTILNQTTQGRRTYRVVRSKKVEGLFWVSIRGDVDSNDKTERKKWIPVCCWKPQKPDHQAVFTTKFSKVDKTSVAFKGFDWLNKATKLWEKDKGASAPNIQIYHEGRCARCGRALTDPASIKRGLGPECYKKSS